MDHTLEAAAHVVLADLADNGGGTYEARTLIPFRPEVGFAVGLGGIHLPVGIVDDEAVAWALRAVTSEYEAAYGGTWQQDGLVYFDAVRYIVDRAQAYAQAVLAAQQAMYDFGQRAVLYLGEAS